VNHAGLFLARWPAFSPEQSKGKKNGLTKRTFIIWAMATALGETAFTAAHAQTSVNPAEARAIAKEAYIYAFPMVDNYRIAYDYFVNRESPEFKAPWNQIRNIPSVFTPADTAVQTPNSDTP
jgi:hypothetical protein